MTEGLLGGVFLFVLATFVGFEVITKIPPTLYTPLMSGTNAISGIVLIGALLVAGRDSGTIGAIVGFLAVVLATVNVVGGFWVTDRMLRMFKKDRNQP
jgi:NAD(P) transhydrogenase subunit alpha